MFKKSQRLSQKEFDEFFKAGKRHHFKHLTLITSPHPSRKVAVVVGKKVAKSAVRRNLLKRRVYASVRESLVDSQTTGVLIVLIKPTFVTLPRRTALQVVKESVAEVTKTA